MYQDFAGYALSKNNLYTSVILSEAKNLAARPFAPLRVTMRERRLASQIVKYLCKVYFLTVPELHAEMLV